MLTVRTFDNSERFLLCEDHLQVISDHMNLTAGVAMEFVRSGCDAHALHTWPVHSLAGHCSQLAHSSRSIASHSLRVAAACSYFAHRRVCCLPLPPLAAHRTSCALTASYIVSTSTRTRAGSRQGSSRSLCSLHINLRPSTAFYGLCRGSAHIDSKSHGWQINLLSCRNTVARIYRPNRDAWRKSESNLPSELPAHIPAPPMRGSANPPTLPRHILPTLYRCFPEDSC